MFETAELTAATNGLAGETGAAAARLAALLRGDGGDEGTVAFLASAASGVPGGSAAALDRLAATLGLARFERDALVLAGLAEDHEGYAVILRRLHPRGEPAATAGLAARLLADGPGERLLVRGLLERGAGTRHRAIVLERGAPFWERSLRVGDGLWSALHGVDAWPEGASAEESPTSLAGLDDWLASPPAARAAAALAAGCDCTVLVTADSESVAADRAAALLVSAAVPFARLGVEPAPPTALLRLLAVHAIVRGVVPVVTVPPDEPPALSRPLRLDALAAPIVVCARGGTVAVEGVRPLLAVAVEPLAPPARRRMWRATLPQLGACGGEVAARYAVEPAAALATAADLDLLGAIERRAPGVADVGASVRARAGLRLPAGVRLVHPTAGRRDLVLSRDRAAQLDEAIARLVHGARVLDDWGFLAGRPGARGVRLLLAGPPGTGKTLTAEVLAATLGVELLLVDISRVVSKWIGETEKNLAEVFDAAERSQAVLCFDEADALFGKRTEVSDAHDRYANLETAYLLQRLERFEGLAVLSTNFRQNVDPAFIRRLEAVLEFDEPGVDERRQLWRCHLPPRAPLADDVDVEELVSLFPVVGAVIRNAAVAAAFAAASSGTPITRAHVLHAMRREYEKSGRSYPGLPTESAA